MLGMIGPKDLQMALSQALIPAVATGVVASGSAGTVIMVPANTYQPKQWAGYFLQFSQDTLTTALQGQWFTITDVATNAVTVDRVPSASPAAGDTFTVRAAQRPGTIDVLPPTTISLAATSAMGFVAPWTGLATIMFQLSQPAAVSLRHEGTGTTLPLLQGAVLNSGQLYTVQVPLRAASAYDLKVSADQTALWMHSVLSADGLAANYSEIVQALTGGAAKVQLPGSYLSQTLVNVPSIAHGGGVSNVIGAAGTFVTLGKYVKAIAITIRVTYGAAVNTAPTCNIYSSPDGVNWDTDAFTFITPSFAGNTTKQRTNSLGLGAPKYIGVQVVNNDGSFDTGPVVVTYQEIS